MTFKLAVKTLAPKSGLHATFMPKPIFGINGSGMHTNMSLFRDGKLELCVAPGIFKLPAPVGRGSLLASVQMLAQLAQTDQAPARRSKEEKELVA